MSQTYSFLQKRLRRDGFIAGMYVFCITLYSISTAVPHKLANMEGGNNVTNYSYGVDRKPSYAFTDATTEFDDALIARGIVTKEQALAAKGMSRQEAQRLASSQSNNKPTVVAERDVVVAASKGSETEEEEDSEDDRFLDDEDDEFLQQYRQKRVAELQQQSATESSKQQQQQQQHGEPVLIDRTEWSRHVNEASRAGWVVVCLTSSDTERTGCVEAAVRTLAHAQTTVKFVMIAAQSAIPNWPDANLPSLFLYRHGRMQHELLRLPVDTSVAQLEGALRERGVLEDDD